MFVKANLFYYCSENRDPLVKILGPSFANILKREDADTDVLHLEDEGKEEHQIKHSEVKVKLFHLLQNIDKWLLNKLLEGISEWVLLIYLLLP